MYQRKKKKPVNRLISMIHFIWKEKITLPISWCELSEMGFRINVSDKDTISSEIRFVEKEIYNFAGEYLGKVSIVNETDSDIKVEDGVVHVFTFLTDVDMNFYGGLSFLSTKEQIVNASQ